MIQRLLDWIAAAHRHVATDLVIGATLLALVVHLGATTLRPVFHNAAATHAELQGDLAAAERHLESAVTLSRRFGAEKSLSSALERLADLLWRAERHAEAEERLVELLAVWEDRLGPSDPFVADVLERLGLAAQYQGRLEDAELRFARSLAIREQTLGAHNVPVARSLVRLGSLARVKGLPARADLYLQRALSLMEGEAAAPSRLATIAPGIGMRRTVTAKRILMAEALYELSALFGAAGHRAEARAFAERGLALTRESGPAWPIRAALLSHLAAIQQADGDGEAALASHREAQRLVQRNGRQGSRLHAALLNNLAVSQARWGAVTDARESLHQAQAIVASRNTAWQPLAGAISANETLLTVEP